MTKRLNAVACAVLSAAAENSQRAARVVRWGQRTLQPPLFIPSSFELIRVHSWLTNEDFGSDRRPWTGKHSRLLPENRRALSRAHRRRALSGIYHRQCRSEEGTRFHGRKRPER